jgi:hypothetical protein
MREAGVRQFMQQKFPKSDFDDWRFFRQESVMAVVAEPVREAG